MLAEPSVGALSPLVRAPMGVPVTQLDMHALQALGVVKIDLLGNRALGAMQETAAWIGAAPAAAESDERTFELLRLGRTLGCFQVETPTMRSLLSRLPLRGVEDLMAALALVRPGPASGEAKAAYLRRARGEEAETAPHPRLAAALRGTRGMLLYEEDIMASAAAMTGMSIGQADELRLRILETGGDPEGEASLEREFVSAAKSAGVPEGEGRAVWRELRRFASYSFNKAHAASYAMLAYRSAWLRAHHPAEFACGVLNSYGGMYPLRAVAADLARSGVRFLRPDVNRSSARPCTLEGGAVRIGLGQVKWLAAKSRRGIAAGRPFENLADLVARLALPWRELEALVLSGACDELEPLEADVYPFAHQEALRRLQLGGAAALEGEWALPATDPAFAPTYRKLVRAHNELRFLELHPSGHPIEALREEAARQGCVPIAEAAECSAAGQEVRIAAIVSAARRLELGNGRVAQFVTLEDESGLIEARLGPSIYAALADPIRSPGPYLASGDVHEDRGDVLLSLRQVLPFHLRADAYGRAAS